MPICVTHIESVTRSGLSASDSTAWTDYMLSYKGEMVTLSVPFRNEVADVLDRHKFTELYDTNNDFFMSKRKE